MKHQAGFLRKTARLDKKKKFKNEDVEAQILHILKNAKDHFDDYQSLIAGFAMSQLLGDILARPNLNLDYLRERKIRLDNYLANIASSMKKDI